MVKLKFNNRQNESYPYRRVWFDVETGRFLLEDETELHLSEKKFTHPLLQEPYTEADDFEFKYEYRDFSELMYAMRFMCTVLLNTRHPQTCQFTIQPAADFQKAPLPESVYFSIHHRKAAKEKLSVEQLNRLVSTLSGKSFQYSNDQLLRYHMTLKDLPEVIDVDELYTSQIEMQQILDNLKHCDAYELRYIDSMLGFGVFSRTQIQAGSIMSLYSGIQTYTREKRLDYSFTMPRHPSNVYIHASEFGNLTRFINHAAEANVKAVQYQVNGVTFVLFEAKRDIEAGEQLLVDYGGQFFEGEPVTLFKPNGKIAYQSKPKTFSKRNLMTLRVMANQGVRAASAYFWKRLFVITVLLGVILGPRLQF